jgi:hypothetical protein
MMWTREPRPFLATPGSEEQVPGKLLKAPRMKLPADVAGYAFAIQFDLQPRLGSKQVEALTTFQIGEL